MNSALLPNLYNLLSVVALPFAILYHWYRSISRGRKSAFAERFGILSKKQKELIAGQKIIWLHAVSVGEVIAARPLIKGIRTAFPAYRILLTVTTETGREVAEKDALADMTTYFPFDLCLAVNSLLNIASPKAVIIMETEIWPVFTFQAKKRRIPLLLANGRISERSFPRYLRFAWFFKPVLDCFSGLGMQSGADLQRILAIGAPEERCQVAGNLKYDIPFSAVAPEERQQLRNYYHIPDDLIILTAASTHSGEEELLLQVYKEISEQWLNLLLVLVPRHPERTTEIEVLAGKSGYTVIRRSSLENKSEFKAAAGMVLLVDTVGELMQIYAFSDLAFVGGSLVPTGGHNLLEPASRGIPFLFGPYMENFLEIKKMALEYGAGIQVADLGEFKEAVADFIRSPELRQVIGTNGLKLLRDSGGSVERHLAMLKEVMTQ